MPLTKCCFAADRAEAPAEGQDFGRRRGPCESGDDVGLQAGTDNEAIEHEDGVSCRDTDFAVSGGDGDGFMPEHDLSACGPDVIGHGLSNGHKVYDGGMRRMQRRYPCDVRFDLAHRRGTEAPQPGHAVRHGAAFNVCQGRKFVAVRATTSLPSSR